MKATLLEMELHNGIKARDDISFSKLCVQYLEKVVQTVGSRRNYYRLFKNDAAVVHTATIDAFLSYYNNPESFNPHKSTLLRFLEIAAEGDLKNALTKEGKRTSRQKSEEDVELQEKFRNSIVKGNSSPITTMITEETMNAIQNILERFFSNDTDILLARMVMSKERETNAYVEVLEIGLLTVEEQRIEVKKNKDRIKQVLKRNDIENKIKSHIL